MPETPSTSLTEDEIKARIEAYCRDQQDSLPFSASRKASVLIPLYWEGGEWHVLFTRRSDKLNDHKGQVSFPGGAIDRNDGNVYRAALREAFEEIGLETTDTKILGRLKDYWTISDFIVSPIVARIKWPFTMVINHEEVGRVFSIPLSFLADKRNIEIKIFTLPNGRDTRLFSFAPYDGEVVWGITARIMIRLLKVLDFLERDY